MQFILADMRGLCSQVEFKDSPLVLISGGVGVGKTVLYQYVTNFSLATAIPLFMNEDELFKHREVLAGFSTYRNLFGVRYSELIEPLLGGRYSTLSRIVGNSSGTRQIFLLLLASLSYAFPPVYTADNVDCGLDFSTFSALTEHLLINNINRKKMGFLFCHNQPKLDVSLETQVTRYVVTRVEGRIKPELIGV